ncbi:Protein transport protein use1 [Porphyridium purpureum]|uniref:Protein transport protein use1 n=1 Tax=Porphyridium purpureum TaxID=35688 RepID=A0A5J4YQ51_PORPP|nr:Protein transport protein use1 [Porphyridium purpureum]|eukprot:POR9587..scf296_7
MRSDSLGVQPRTPPDAVLFAELEWRRALLEFERIYVTRQWVGSGSTQSEALRDQLRAHAETMRACCEYMASRAQRVSGPWPGLDNFGAAGDRSAHEVVRGYEIKTGDIMELASRLDAASSQLQAAGKGADSFDMPRAQLMGGASLRRRRSAHDAAADTATSDIRPARHVKDRKMNPEQEQLTEELLEMVGRLKENFVGINTQLNRDNELLDETNLVLERNLGKVKASQGSLDAFSRTSRWRTLQIYLAVLVAVLVWVFVLFFIYVTRFL